MAKQKKNKLERPTLPIEGDDNYLQILVDHAVMAYSRFLSDNYALDWLGVRGRTRVMIIESEDYIRRTKQCRADKVLEDIEEIEDIAYDLAESIPDENDSDYDIRSNPDAIKAFDKDSKDNLAARLKVAEIRRDRLQMTNGADERSEVDALNIFFIPVTEEEFAALGVTEVHEGDDSGRVGFETEATQEEKLRDKRLKQGTAGSDEDDNYLPGLDGPPISDVD